MLLLRECLPRKCHKRVESPNYQPRSMYKVYEMCGSLSTKCNAHNTLDVKWAELIEILFQTQTQKIKHSFPIGILG